MFRRAIESKQEQNLRIYASIVVHYVWYLTLRIQWLHGGEAQYHKKITIRKERINGVPFITALFNREV